MIVWTVNFIDTDDIDNDGHDCVDNDDIDVVQGLTSLHNDDHDEDNEDAVDDIDKAGYQAGYQPLGYVQSYTSRNRAKAAIFCDWLRSKGKGKGELWP